jgi:hypothetical protein
MEVPMYKDGTIIEAEAGCGAHSIRGRLVGDHECLDDVLTVFDLDEGDTIRINGWLWSIEVVDDPAE